jgi:uncharacterized membrane protein YkgB
MHELGKGLVILGIVLVVVGAVLLLGPKVPLLGKLPGDIVIKRENFTFSFPLATSIVLSVIISLVLYLLGKLR